MSTLVSLAIGVALAAALLFWQRHRQRQADLLRDIYTIPPAPEARPAPMSPMARGGAGGSSGYVIIEERME